MGLALRINYDDKDYVYEIINSKLINQNTTELELLLNGERIHITKNVKQVWVATNNESSVDPDLIQALGRSVSLRMRM